MKVRGGYDVQLAGRPAEGVETAPPVERLHLPLWSRRFDFSDVRVDDGQAVTAGAVLATDPRCHAVPLLAPYGGTVRLGAPERHITLEAMNLAEPVPYDVSADPDAGELDARQRKLHTLMHLGAWAYLRDAETGDLPDPAATPAAVIVSTMRREPYTTRGDVQLQDRLEAFRRGLAAIQSLLEYQPIYLAIPEVSTAFAQEVREMLRGEAWIHLLQVPLRYGCDHFAVLARRLGYKRSAAEVIWCLRTEGVFAVHRAMNDRLATPRRIVALGGPAVGEPKHLDVPVGYPLRALLDDRLNTDADVRVIDGGVLTGRVIGPEQRGVGTECIGVTVLPEAHRRELVGWIRPGFDRRSFSRCFGSALRRGDLAEPLTTALRGEGRPCLSCNFCEEVCPARIMPHVIHKLLYQDALEEVESAGVELCTECGLCSFVCPSKIELRGEFIEAKRRIAEEKQAAEAPA